MHALGRSLAIFLLACLTSACAIAPRSNVERAPGVLAVVGGLIIDPAGEDAPRPATILVEDGRITAIGQDVRIPARARVIDVGGRYISPGLWDMHAHLNALDPVGRKPERYVGHGVLAVRDMGGHLSGLLALKAELVDGRVGPELVIAGPTLNGQAFADFHRVVATEAEAREAVRELRNAGVDLIKVHRAVAPDVFAAIVDESRRQRLPVAGHVPLGLSWSEASDMGMQGIEHVVTLLENEMALRDDPASNQAAAVTRLEGPAGRVLLTTLARNRTYLDPTLVHYENRLRGADSAAAAQARPLFMRARAFVGAAQAVGVPILAGTDESEAPGQALWDELDLLVASGLTPRQALRAATSTAAEAANRPALGRIALGAPASFIILDGDPSADIGAVRQLWMVVLGGRVLDAGDLARLRG